MPTKNFRFKRLHRKPVDTIGYRTKRLPGGRRLLLAIRRRKGKRGGRTVAVEEMIPRRKGKR